MFFNQNMMEGEVINEKIYVSVGIQTETQEEDQIAMDVVAMWHIIETGMGLKVPVYLKNIMRLEGYDTTIAIQKISADNIEELELFGRKEMHKFIKKGEKYSDYFDKYYICPSEFRIPIGHKILLSEIQKFVTNKLSSDKMYFTPELRLEKSNCQPRKLTKSMNFTMNQKRKNCASQTASKLQNEDFSPSSSQHTNSGSNPDTLVDINLNAEHDSLYGLVMAWLKNQNKRKNCASQTASKLQNEDFSPNSSQHTNSGSNPDTLVDINLNAEHDSLYGLVMAWLKNQIKYTLLVNKQVEKHVVENFSPASVEINIIEERINDSSESSNYAAKIEANIICPICQKKTKAHKLEYGKQGKMRWVKSNFERHLKSHFSNAGSPCGRDTRVYSNNHPVGKIKQVPLENFFLQSPSENQLEDDEPTNAMDSAKNGISEDITETASSGE
nr:PREDICTED: uncharacterized protein LOC105679515 [Linepithema humile]